ncbi:MAG: amidohydrolase family protein, partial [Candidatus Binatia bacterium]|nr:amidohydrolase family protein [Candidatus Binatia bacterium]
NNPRLKVVGNFSLRREAAQQEHEICQQIETKAICGVKFYPGYENYFPVDQRPQTIYKLCATLRVPVIFHTGFLQEGTLGNQEQTHPRNIEALAEQHPDLKIIMAHFGNPWVQETAKAIAKHNNLYVDLSGFFTEYKTVLSTELVEFQGAMTTFANIAGGFSKCLFGTDWPLYSQKEYLAAVKTLPMNEREQKLVFWENATLLFDR